MKSVIELGGKMGATALIFGSPKNRAYENMTNEEAWERAAQVFKTLGDYAVLHDTHVCIEPNPPSYNTNFITNSKDGAAFVRIVDSPGFCLHLDSGAMHMNEENYEEIIATNIDIIRHVHASEPNLKDLSEEPQVDYKRLGTALKGNDYQYWVSIEMLTKEHTAESVRTALEYIRNIFLKASLS